MSADPVAQNASEATTPAPTLLARLQLGRVREYGIVIVFIALFVVLAIASPTFLNKQNILNVLSQNAPIGIMACGGTLVIIAGGFDLSVGAIYGLAGVVAAKLALTTDPVLALVLGVGAGLVLGLANGALTNLFAINSFIATLASGYIFRGIASIITGGFLVGVQKHSFSQLGSAELFEVKISVYIFVAMAILTGIFLTRTRYGRYVFAAGGNAEAARLSGVRVELVRAMTFTFSGVCAGLAGVIAASRVSSGQSDAGAGLELAVIAAVVIGGTSIAGGVGAIWRSILGVLLIAMIGNGFNILNIDPFYEPIVQGTIILIAVVADSRTEGPLTRMIQRWRARRTLPPVAAAPAAGTGEG